MQFADVHTFECYQPYPAYYEQTQFVYYQQMPEGHCIVSNVIADIRGRVNQELSLKQLLRYYKTCLRYPNTEDLCTFLDLKMRKKLGQPWSIPVHFGPMILNNYMIGHIRGDFMTYYDFLATVKVVSQQEPQWDEFRDDFEIISCPNWWKSDPTDGLVAEKRSSVCKQPPELIRISNMSALFDLPYHKGLILRMARFACVRNKCSVYSVNILCEWFMRKCKQMYQATQINK